ncbi:FadR/GntR family transcriptional regulator [Variovorax paradoxus]|nr:FadR/GntR family transcriptional regulator [Variovorax paradoxus]
MAEHLLDVNGGTLPDQIYARMVEAILRGDYVDSKKLPTESELASQFGVSRPTVREALSRLRSDGIIESRRGSGSQVVRAPGTPASSMPPIRNYSDIERYYAYRTVVESGAAAAAAEFRTADDLTTIRACLEAQTLAMEGGNKGIEDDVRFHRAIARASHNQFFVAAVETSVAPIRQFMELARSVRSKMTAERVRLVQMEHQQILDAIEKRSPADAAEATRLHILNAKRRIFDAAKLR